MGITERKEREKEQRRNMIINAAEKIFFKKGIESSTMDDVANAAELSKGTLYLYFKSKEDIQLAIALRGSDILREMMHKHLSAHKTGFENLLELAEISINFSEKQKHYYEFFLFFHIASFDKLNLEKSRVIQYLTEQSPLAIVLECVKKGIADKSLRADIPAGIFAATLWSQLLGVLIVINYKKNIYKMFGLNPEDILKTHLELVSVGTRGSEGGKEESASLQVTKSASHKKRKINIHNE
jgi:AcrR family transcriptional regulator